MTTNLEKLYPMMIVSLGIVIWFLIIILLTIGYLLLHFKFIKPYLEKRKKTKEMKKNEPIPTNGDIHSDNSADGMGVQSVLPKTIPKKRKQTKKRG